jgi:hypothetical protein
MIQEVLYENGEVNPNTIDLFFVNKKIIEAFS